MKSNIKEILKKETELVDIKMSEKLLNTDITTSKDISNLVLESDIENFEKENILGTKNADLSKNKKKFRLNYKIILPSILSVFCLMLIVTSIFLVKDKNKNVNASSLTTYIIDVNPSFCITTDEDDIVVSACSLNTDGDSIISDEEFSSINGKKIDECLCIIIKCLIDRKFISFNAQDSSKVINFQVTNNKESYANLKGDMVRQYCFELLSERGFDDYEIKNYFLPVKDFSNKMGFKGDNRDLDALREEIISYDRFSDHPTLII